MVAIFSRRRVRVVGSVLACGESLNLVASVACIRTLFSQTAANFGFFVIALAALRLANVACTKLTNNGTSLLDKMFRSTGVYQVLEQSRLGRC